MIATRMEVTGSQIDRYAIERTLGEGGFGSVYLARHTVLGTRVALKVLSAKHTASPTMVERFLREAQMAAGIGNPHIVSVSDAGVTSDGRPFLAMEVLEGEDLEQRLRRSGALPLDLALEIVQQILTALEAAHFAGIVHRDMKPANVFLTRGPDGRPFAKLLDFGISKVIDPARASNLTGTGMTLGTPAYMAPEQLENTKTVDHRADLYAVGAILFESLTGRLPYPAESLSDLLQRVQGRPPDRLGQHLPGAPPALEAFLSRALAGPPSARFASASEMAHELARVRAAIPTHAQPLTPVMGAWPSAAQVAPPPAVHPVTTAAPRRGPGLWIALGVAAIALPIVCLSAGAVTWMLSEREPSDPVVAPSVSPSPSPAPAPGPSPPGPAPAPPSPAPLPPEATGPPTPIPIPDGADPCAVPVVHQVACDRQWDEMIPTDCQIRRGREMHLLASYEPMTGEGGVVTVDVSRTAAPIVLVLSSYADIVWEVRAAEGVEIAEVFLVGRGNAEIRGLPAGVQSQRRRGFPIMGWEWARDTHTDWTGRDTAIAAEERLELPMRAYAGCYNPRRFFIGQNPP